MAEIFKFACLHAELRVNCKRVVPTRTFIANVAYYTNDLDIAGHLHMIRHSQGPPFPAFTTRSATARGSMRVRVRVIVLTLTLAVSDLGSGESWEWPNPGNGGSESFYVAVMFQELHTHRDPKLARPLG